MRARLNKQRGRLPTCQNHPHDEHYDDDDDYRHHHGLPGHYAHEQHRRRRQRHHRYSPNPNLALSPETKAAVATWFVVTFVLLQFTLLQSLFSRLEKYNQLYEFYPANYFRHPQTKPSPMPSPIPWHWSKNNPRRVVNTFYQHRYVCHYSIPPNTTMNISNFALNQRASSPSHPLLKIFTSSLPSK